MIFADWLALREPYDVKARNRTVLDTVVAQFHDRTSISVVDLACGTGSTFRSISHRLPERQDWRLVDHDLGLLGKAAPLGHPPKVNVTARPVDLAHDLEAALDGLLDLVTTSALLDLVSAEWIERLAVETAARSLPVYAAISYDGRAVLTPADPFDKSIIDAVNVHQHGDRGFGPALGPTAAAAAIARFKTVGYSVIHEMADWDFQPYDHEMQMEVLLAWATAARETDEVSSGEVDSWLARRRDLVTAGRSAIRVGHIDFFARPTGTR